MGGGAFYEFGLLFAAAGLAVGATGVEVAAGGGIDGAGDVTGEDLSVESVSGVGGWNGAEQRFRVGVRGVLEDFFDGADFDDASEVHDGDLVGDVADDGEIVADEEVGEAEFFLEIFEQVEYLGLDGYVERGDRFVGDNEGGFDGECAGDADALALSSAEFIGVSIGGFGGKPDEVEEFEYAITELGFGSEVVGFERFGEHGSDGHAGVE